MKTNGSPRLSLVAPDAAPAAAIAADPAWPLPADAPSIILRFAKTPTERAVLDGWLRATRPADVASQTFDGGDARLGAALDAAAGDPWILPLRVAWLPRDRGGTRAARLSDIVALRDPRRPSPRAQERILRDEPDRCRVVVAEPARISELRGRLTRDSRPAEVFCDFVGRQAELALDRAERNLFGSQYKVPRFVAEELTASGQFHEAVTQLAEELERPDSEVAQEAASYIDEMVASQSRRAIDLWSQFGNWLSRAHSVEADDARLAELQELNRSHPLVFLPSHRSYLDPLVLRSALAGQGFAPSHVMGGINVAFWPIGPVARRSGYVFIRRSFRDNPVYKFALRQYMAYLLRKRFNLEWYIEGGRGRTGKMRPPRLGLLAYLVDAFKSGGVDDAYLVPVSIVYDQLYEVEAMAAEEHGAQKVAESLSWFIGYARAQGRALGKVRVTFGEPLSLRTALEEGEDSVEKVAFEVCHRIGRATTITPTSLVTLALLGAEDRALTLPEVCAALDPLLDYVELRELRCVRDLDLRRPAGVRGTLETLTREGVVTCFAEGAEPVWTIGMDRHFEAAFYRNGAIHFFVNRAIAELVLARASEDTFDDLRAEGREEALRLRDLLKFEFFFAQKDEFQGYIRDELTILDPDWQKRPLEPLEAMGMLSTAPVLFAHRVLRSFLEAYQVVADRLAERDPRKPVDEKAFLTECIGVARQYRLQHRLYSPESISKELFSNALRLAANRDLVDAGREELGEARRAFAEEIRGEVRRIAFVRDLALRENRPSGSAPEATA